MNGSSQVHPKSKPERFLANINADDSLYKSANLLEEILGKKLDKLKMKTKLKESAQKSNNTNTRVQESKEKGEEVVEKQQQVHRSAEKTIGSLSIQVKASLSPRQSDPSESNVDSLLSGSLQKRKFADKDHNNITTQDGLRSDKCSELFDIRLHKVPAGVVAHLESVSQASEDPRVFDRSHGDGRADVSPFDKVLEGENQLSGQEESQYRRSLTEKQIKADCDKSVEQMGQNKGKVIRSRFNESNSKTPRAPTDNNIGLTNNCEPNFKDKTLMVKGKTLIERNKEANKPRGSDHQSSIARPFKGVGQLSSSHREMLEFSENLSGVVSTENQIVPDNYSIGSPRPDMLSTNRVNPMRLNNESSTKCCLKATTAKFKVADIEIPSPLRSSSPSGSKRGILNNRDQVFCSDSMSMYQMVGMPARKSNTIMSKRSETKVRFQEEPDIFIVQSYKKYYNSSSSDSTCCSWCHLI